MAPPMPFEHGSRKPRVALRPPQAIVQLERVKPVVEQGIRRFDHAKLRTLPKPDTPQCHTQHTWIACQSKFRRYPARETIRTSPGTHGN